MKEKEAIEIGSEVLEQSVKTVGLGDTDIKKSKESRFSYLTQTDEDLDSEIRGRLNEQTGVPILSEESDQIPESTDYWVVDPIDGTIPFAHSMPNYVTMLAFVSDGLPKASVIHSPPTEHTFTATQETAYLNGTEIQSSDAVSVNEEAVFNSIRADGVHESDKFRSLHQELTRNSIVFGVYCAGFGAIKIATGDAVASVYMALSEWDYMPTIRLVESSGGVVGSLKTGEIGAKSLIDAEGDVACFASSTRVFEEIHQMYQN